MGDAQHIADEELEAYLSDTLPEPRLAAVEEHLLWCHQCLDRIESLERHAAR